MKPSSSSSFVPVMTTHCGQEGRERARGYFLPHLPPLV